jgi:aquaporin Z
MQMWQKYAAEVYGTFVLVGVGTGTILGVGGAADPAGLVGIALAFGLALAVGLYSVGAVSGGHFNPAVSLAAYLDRRIDLTDMIGYWVAQLVGAVLASGALAVILDADSVGGTATALNKPTVGSLGGVVAEAVLTAIFVLTILVVATHRSHLKFLVIGLTLTAVHLIGIAFTGASVNPARSFGPALIGGTWDDFWVYVFGPLIGAVLAWVLYKVIVTGDTDLVDDLYV